MDQVNYWDSFLAVWKLEQNDGQIGKFDKVFHPPTKIVDGRVEELVRCFYIPREVVNIR
jgi:hypothetical protein